MKAKGEMADNENIENIVKAYEWLYKANEAKHRHQRENNRNIEISA
jgi:hypothetical protein